MAVIDLHPRAQAMLDASASRAAPPRDAAGEGAVVILEVEVKALSRSGASAPSEILTLRPLGNFLSDPRQNAKSRYGASNA